MEDNLYQVATKVAKVGRPCKWQHVDEIIPYIDDYFKNTPKEEWTITGLALSLGTTRSDLIEYEARGEFRNVIKSAKTLIENGYEIDLKQKGRVGSIFALKQFGWVDKYEVDNNVTLSIGGVLDKIESHNVTGLENSEIEAIEGESEDVE